MYKTKKYSLMSRSIIILLLLILPFNIIGIITAFFSYNNSIKNAENVISYALDSYVTLLNTRIKNTHLLFYNLEHNNIQMFNMCTAETYTDFQLKRYQLFSDLSEEIKLNNSSDYLFFYIDQFEDYMQVPGYTAINAGSKPYLKYVQHFDLENSQWFLSEDHSELIRLLYSQSLNAYYGAVIDLDSFLSQFEQIDSFEQISYCFSNEELYLQGHLCFNYEIKDDIYFSAALPNSALGNNITVISVAIILFFLLYLALLPLLIYLLRKNVEEPLLVLNAAHKELESGNEDYRITKHDKSYEFDHAFISFNNMASSIQTLHKNIIETELSNKQLQIDFLQLQIRPHFLLNSFNVLFTLIQQGKRESAQKMVLYLSDYFRYLFRKGRELQLFSKERKLIEEYMEITKIYYPVSFEVSYQIDPIIDLMRIPPLLFHSFMENIIAHALLPDRQLHIVFSGEYDKGLVTFYISDDGKGMDADAVEAINHGVEKPLDDGKNIGIKNSIRRLKYYYGNDANVICDSEINIGTTFTITIPYDLEDETDEVVDC